MDPYFRWIPSSLVLLAVFALAATVPVNGVVLDTVLITLAVGLLIASYVLRHRARKRLVYQRDRDVEHRPNPSRVVTPPDAAPPPRRPRS